MFRFIEHLKGKVTSVNKVLCILTIKCDDSVECTIYAALANLALPKEGDDVIIFKLFNDLKCEKETNFYLEEDSEFYNKSEDIGEFTQKTMLGELIHKNGWGIEDLRYFIYSLETVNFKGIDSYGEDDYMVISILEWTFQKRKKYGDILLSTPALCRYVKYDLVNPKGPHFSHGIHHNRHNEFLFGLLLSNQYSQLQLTDGKHCIFLKIYSRDKWNLRDLVDHFVCIKKFTIITEVYRAGINLDFLICDYDDIEILWNTIIKQEKCIEHFYLRSLAPDLATSTIYIINIATPNSTANKGMECWVYVKRERGFQWFDAYLCFQTPLFSTLSLLNIGGLYRISFTDKLVFHTDPEIKRVTNCTQTYKVGKCLIARTQTFETLNFPECKILSLRELCSAMEKFDGRKTYVNFEATVTLKIFCTKSAGSRTKKQINSIMFDTPGDKTHMLRFEDKIEELKVTMYLNNWERKQCPLGIVPQIRVVVRHAELTKNYLRSNALTSFEIVGYDNPIIYNTANLNPDNPRVFYNHLGNGHLIPYGVLIRAKPMMIKIRSFKLTYTHELQLLATFYTIDPRGGAFVICKSVDLFKKVLFTNESQFNSWLNIFKEVRFFSIYEEDEPPLSPEHKRFYKCMLFTVKTFFSKRMLGIDWLCRRMEPKRLTDNKGLPLWFECGIMKLEI